MEEVHPAPELFRRGDHAIRPAEECESVVLLIEDHRSDHAQEPSESAIKSTTSKTPANDIKAERPGANKIQFLDGLRGIAIIMVMWHHGGYIGHMDMGGVGVDIFFILSAFLLTLIFERQARTLVERGATPRQWGFMLVDYLCKRFLRVYPLFIVVVLVLWVLPAPLQERYYHIQKGSFNLLKVLTFHPRYRYFLLWSLPIEIQYYFVLPIFTTGMVLLQSKWWVPSIVVSAWIVYEGCTNARGHKKHLAEHLPTFVAGSLAAIVFTKIDQWRKQTKFEFTQWYRLGLRVIEYFMVGLFWSICFSGLYFNTLFKNPFEPKKGAAHFITVPVTFIIVIEMLVPSVISQCLEWNVLRAWGKVSFSAYLLHVFVIYTPFVNGQPYYDRLFMNFVFTFILAMISNHVVEQPSQRIAVKVSKFISSRT